MEENLNGIIKTKLSYLKETENIIKKKLYNKYGNCTLTYQINKINDLIYEKNSNFSCIYYDLEIYGNVNEFLINYYKKHELLNKLKKILHFYQKYSKIYPNYIILNGVKYLYKNILSKQRIINNIVKNRRNEKMNRLTNKEYSIIFTTKEVCSIWNESNSYYHQNLSKIMYMDEDDEDNGYSDINDLIYKIDWIENEVNKKFKIRLQKSLQQENRGSNFNLKLKFFYGEHCKNNVINKNNKISINDKSSFSNNKDNIFLKKINSETAIKTSSNYYKGSNSVLNIKKKNNLSLVNSPFKNSSSINSVTSTNNNTKISFKFSNQHVKRDSILSIDKDSNNITSMNKKTVNNFFKNKIAISPEVKQKIDRELYLYSNNTLMRDDYINKIKSFKSFKVSNIFPHRNINNIKINNIKNNFNKKLIYVHNKDIIFQKDNNKINGFRGNYFTNFTSKGNIHY